MAIYVVYSAHDTDTDPRIQVWQVVVTNKGATQGVWQESLGSTELRDAFIQGVRAGASMFRDLDVNVAELRE